MTVYSLDGISPELPSGGRYFVADNAHVIGRVRLHRDASIWFGTVARGDNEWIEIGEGTNIQDGCMLHADPGFPLTVGARCTIGHHAILHGCTIGEQTLVGMGAIIMNGARIGGNCIVGAGAVVTEGKEFPDNLLILGAPAKAARTLDEKARETLAYASEFYVKNGQRFKAGLKVVG